MSQNIRWNKSYLQKFKNKKSLMLAMYWQYFYGIKNKLKLFLSNHKIISIGLIIGMLIILNIAIYPSVYGYVKPYFEINDRMSSLQSLFLGLGGALTGATAIAFSLIMFAMQVNVERLPYGLFKKFSTDFKLLGLFIIIMLLAISISSMSLIQDATWSTKFICIAFWNISIIILLTLTAYKRALTLISPFEQLAILVSHTKKNLTLWSKAANRAVPLLRKSNVEDKEDTFATPNHDIEKAFYLNSLNPYWTIKALQAIEYCTAIARYHAVQGDYEISQAAIDSIVIINGHYIIAKRKTFYVDPPFFCSGKVEMSPLGKVEMSPFGPIEANLKWSLHGWESKYVRGVTHYEHKRDRPPIGGAKGT